MTDEAGPQSSPSKSAERESIPERELSAPERRPPKRKLLTKASEEAVARKRGGQARQVENEDSDEEEEEDEERMDDPDWEDESGVLDDEEHRPDQVRIIRGCCAKDKCSWTGRF